MSESGVVLADVSGFDSAFATIFADFFDQTVMDSKKAVSAGGRACRDMLQGTTDPGMTGEYASGWRMRMKNDRFGGYYVRVYNATKPSLTHLLEMGHEMFVHGRHTGRRVPAHPHIADAAEHGEGVMLRVMADGKG